MLDGLLQLLLDDAGEAIEPSRRVQLVTRAIFGTLGAGLGVAGMVLTALRPDAPNLGMRIGMIGVFLAMTWFCVGTVLRGRSPKPSAWLLGLSFLLLFGSAVAR